VAVATCVTRDWLEPITAMATSPIATTAPKTAFGINQRPMSGRSCRNRLNN
jgi:hypothetical protein